MALKRRRKVPKMSGEDVTKVLHELDAWCRRERPGRLTWQRLEEASGFTRQALSSRPEIAERYGQAKIANRPSGSAAKPLPKTTDQRVIDLQRRINQLEAVINRYDERWARYARNAALLGVDLERLEEPMDPPPRSHVRVHQQIGGARSRANLR